MDRISCEELLQRRKRLRRELLEKPALQDLRIAVLGGVTTNEVVDFLEILLLKAGFRPAFYQSEYNKYFEDAVVDSLALREFKPDLVYVHTHWMNIQHFPAASCTEPELDRLLKSELSRYQAVWQSIGDQIGCQIIQNNFENPPIAILGNLDGVAAGGRTRFINELNCRFAAAARENRKLLIQDIHSIAARLGHTQWHDWARWYSYKIPTTPDATLAIAESLAGMIGAMLGRIKKCLVLDLDNTLWGGVIGDDGVDKIQIGKETPVAEAYTAFQQYCLRLRDRGILLAVCSKNEPGVAQAGLAHPESVLKLEHFSAFKANWDPKNQNIAQIAAELNLGLDSFVFVDDNPAERALVKAQLPAVTVPDIGSDVALYPTILDAGRYFEPVTLSKEDLERAASYAANTSRAAQEARFADYGTYLDSLHMEAEIDVFKPVYLERIAQLINKTNQFNLTTRRYTYAEVADIAASKNYIPLYGKLSDAFGDNGLISIIIGRREGETLHIDLWLMSCRVLKRDMELAMLDSLVERAREKRLNTIVGYYRQTEKNAMVKDHYQKLGFAPTAEGNGPETVWRLEVTQYTPRNRHIAVPRKVAATNV